MHQLREQTEPEPIERLHLYIVREEEDRQPPLLSLSLSIILLAFLVAVGVFYPYRPPLVRQTLTVPAILLPLQSFSDQETVIPTGTKTYPATNATGTITITNGSILSQHLPAGMIFTAFNGIEVVTTEAVDVPAGNGTSYGLAYVSAKAVSAGVTGNISPLAIDAVYGTSLYIKNYQSFRGGKESYSVSLITPQDSQDALLKARDMLFQHTLISLLLRPCGEKVTGVKTLSVTWICQFVTYQVAGKVLSAAVQGRYVVVEVVVVARKQIFETK